MSIGKSIRKLLEEGNTVVLPGFGRMVVKVSAESFPASSRYLDPPGKRVAFDGSFSKDDGILARQWAEEGQLNGEEARQQVLELVDAIRFALDKGEPYPLPDAGSFRRDDDGRVHFTPDKDWILDPDQYGLEFIELLELEDFPIESGEKTRQEELPVEAIPLMEKEEERSSAGESPSEEAPVEKKAEEEIPKKESEGTGPPPFEYAPSREDEYVERSHRRTKAWKLVWAVAGLLIVVLVVLILIPTDKLGILEEKDDLETVEESTAPMEDVFVPDEAAVEEIPEEEEATGEVKQGEELEHRYFLIAGSFSKLINASELQDKLNAMGYEAQVLVTEGRMYRVSVASFADKGEALQELAEVQKVSSLEAVWLLSNE